MPATCAIILSTLHNALGEYRVKPDERMIAVADAIKQYNPTAIESINDFSVDDLAKISAEQNMKPDDMPKLIGIMIYIRKRLIDRLSRVKSFEVAFPERCIVNDDKEYISNQGNYATKAKSG
jgi:hypothetical protein